MKAKTMIYLEREELEQLRARARRQRISLAEAVRRAVRASLEADPRAPKVPASAYAAIVGLGSSGRRDVSTTHDAALARALTSRRRAR
jgi:hypothetical protein